MPALRAPSVRSLSPSVGDVSLGVCVPSSLIRPTTPPTATGVPPTGDGVAVTPATVGDGVGGSGGGGVGVGLGVGVGVGVPTIVVPLLPAVLLAVFGSTTCRTSSRVTVDDAVNV